MMFLHFNHAFMNVIEKNNVKLRNKENNNNNKNHCT